MAFLITGGAGFIGSHLVDKLIEQGREIIVLDNFSDYYEPGLKRKNIEQCMKCGSFKLVEGNILDDGLLKELFSREKIEKVVHLAACVGVRASIKEPLLYEEINVRGTLKLLQLSVENNVEQFIFASSSSVYGIGAQVPFRENCLSGIPASPYASSKHSAEHFCHTYSHLYKMGMVVLRFFTVYGPRQRPEMAIRKFTGMIDRGEKIPVFGSGFSKRDYTYVSDIIEGMISVMEKSFDYEIFNLGDSRTVELMELIRLIEKNLGKKAKIEKLPDQPGDVPITYADITKAEKLLGYKPEVSIEEGIKKFVDWFRRNSA